MLAWWQKDDKKLLLWEIEYLRSRGILVRDVVAEEATGACSISVCLTIGENQKVELKIHLPLTYPENPPEVIALDLGLSHHLNPQQKNLCTLYRPLTNWDRGWALGDFLQDQIPKAIQAGSDDKLDSVGDLEAHQAEPVSMFLPYEVGSVVLVDGTAELAPRLRSGTFELSVSFNDNLLKAILLRVSRKSETLEHVTTPHIWGNPSAMKGNWARVTLSPGEFSADEYLARLSAENFAFADQQWYSISNEMEVAIFGVLFQEEIRYRENADSWLFIVKRRRRKSSDSGRASFIRTLRADRKSMLMRLPNYGDIQHKSVTIVGQGCVGAPLSVELSKTGIGRLLLVDPDFVDPGPTVRWPIGIAYSGDQKVFALKHFIDQNFSMSKIDVSFLRFGSALEGPTGDQYEQIIDGASLIIDATAEITVTWALAQLAKERAIPFMSISSTPGGISGQIIVIRPDEDVCAECIAYHQKYGDVPSPRASVDENIQPAGCGEPTFVAAGFDTAQISLAAARVAIHLLGGIAKQQLKGNYFVLSLEDDHGAPTIPQWQAFSLGRHDLCPKH